MASIIENAQDKAKLLAHRLQSIQDDLRPSRIVFAESCTAGLVSALMGQVPGISDFLCGSAVTYRASVKQDWLGVDQKTINEFTTESGEVTEAMALGVLSKTSEATYSSAITGHLGPGAPAEIDGKVFIACAMREKSGQLKTIGQSEFKLGAESRTERQYEAATLVIEFLSRCLS